MRLILFCLSLALTASPSLSQEALGLAAPAELAQGGLLKYILPRFSLKTGVRVVADPAGPMELAKGPPGTPVFRAGETVYYLRAADEPRQQRFRDWLLSDIGKRTVESFKIDGEAPYSAKFEVKTAAKLPRFTGDAARGAELALAHCGRCHVIGPQNRSAGIGSTPSFMALRALKNWAERFQTFYVRNPHPAFLQIAGITLGFDLERPPPIVPLEISQREFEAILAYVAAVPAADLGAPLHLQ